MGLLAAHVWDFLFPVRCVSCRAPGAWWCPTCRADSESIRRNPCPECASRQAVHECPRALGLDGLAAVGFYHDPKMRAVIHALKYRGATVVLPDIGLKLAEWSTGRLDVWPWAGEPALAIQPAIAAPQSRRSRGFDQAVLLSESVRDILVPWAEMVDLLERCDGLSPQAKLEAAALRRANVAGSFSLKSGATVPPAVLLVDDVLTTGATLSEIVWVLRSGGAQRIYALVLAIGA